MALRATGLRVEVLAWDDPTADFASARLDAAPLDVELHRAARTFLADWPRAHGRRERPLESAARRALEPAQGVPLDSSHARVCRSRRRTSCRAEAPSGSPTSPPRAGGATWS